MRTELIKRGALAVAAAFLALPAHAQDSMVLSAQPPAAPAAVSVAPVRHTGHVLNINGDRTIAPGEVVDGDVVVFNGDLTVAGEVRGDVTVARGNLQLESGAVVTGNAVVTAGKLVNRGARVAGEMRVVDEGRAMGLQDGVPVAGRVRLGRSWFAPIGRGLMGLMETLALGLVLAGVGVGLIFYAMPQLNGLSDTVRRSTGRAAAVGIAAHFLVLPAFLLGGVALFVTIIGIPLLAVYVPLFIVAVLAAAAVGLVTVAHALGERTAEQRGTYEARHRNAYSYVFTGLGLLLAPLVVANLLGMTGFLGFVGDLVGVFAAVILWAATSVGIGAVLMGASRAWRERRYRRMMGLGAMDAAADTGGAHAA